VLLDKLARTAPETIRYNGFAREMLLGLLNHPTAEVRDLRERVGLAT
jgi:hypothetical protein